MSTSTIPVRILLVGHDGSGVVDPAGEFHVVVRDIASNPVPNADVALDLSHCTDLAIAAQQPFPGVVAQCGTKTVHAITGADGKAVFRIVGGATVGAGAPGTPHGSGVLYADGVRLGSVVVAAPDRTGADGITANDLGTWIADYFAGLDIDRLDLDGSGTINSNDLAAWLAIYFTGGSTHGANSLPGGLCP